MKIVVLHYISNIMPTIVVPKKICSHCGGNKWYINPKTEQEICYEKIMESNRRYHKTKEGKIALERARAKQRANLTDDYIRQIIYVSVYNTTGEKIERKSIPKKHVEKYKEFMNFKRQNKLTSYGNKILKHEKIRTYCK